MISEPYRWVVEIGNLTLHVVAKDVEGALTFATSFWCTTQDYKDYDSPVPARKAVCSVIQKELISAIEH